MSASLAAPQSEIDQLLTTLAQHRAGRIDLAEAGYRRVLADNPRQANALHLLGVVTLTSGRGDEAMDLLRRAVTERPGNRDSVRALAEACAAAALSLLRENRAEPALDLAMQGTGHGPDLAETWFAQGAALRATGDPGAAITALNRALTLDPQHARAHLTVGNAYLDRDQFAVAEIHLRRAIRLQPDLPEAHASLGFLLTSAGRLTEAVAACDEAIRLRPDFARAFWNRSFAHLLAGRLAQGWEDYEWRKRHDRFAADFTMLPGDAWPAREWRGDTLEGHTVLVRAEQGLGDSIQFARYLPLLAARGARVVLACQRPLIPLMRRLDGLAAVVDSAGGLPPYDLWVDQMSLPRLFATRLDSIPSPGGYLRTGAARAAASPRRRIGLVWAGNPLHHNDSRRSIPFATLAALLALPDIDWISLQVGAADDDRAGSIVADPPQDLTDFAATAAAIATLDLVIAVDTSTAHLAGAMGRPVWVLLPFAPDWRWLRERHDSPWYDSMRLFRQPRAGDWTSVVAQVGKALIHRFKRSTLA